jgi:type I restriction-modification system DNA methylase subunit
MASKLQNEFKRIDNILLEDAGTNGANDYMAQMSRILFLKYLDDLEDIRKQKATKARKSARRSYDAALELATTLDLERLTCTLIHLCGGDSTRRCFLRY